MITREVELMTWFIPKGDSADGVHVLKQDCILVATLSDGNIDKISLFVSEPAAKISI